MKNIVTRVSVLFLTCMMITTMLHAQQDSSIKLVTESWDPWFTETPDGRPSGIFSDFTRELFSRAGLNYSLKFYPWQRCLLKMKNGDGDALLMLAKTPEREEYMAFTEDVVTDSVLVYSHVDNLIEWSTWEDLTPYTIGITMGYDYGKDFEQADAQYHFTLDEAVKDELNILKLHAKRFEIAFLNKSVTETYLRKHPKLNTIKASQKPVQEEVYYIAFSKKSKYAGLVPELNHIIQEMKADGSLQEIFTRYSKK